MKREVAHSRGGQGHTEGGQVKPHEMCQPWTVSTQPRRRMNKA
jgi:hypothetical protein